jgi:hypothetical protein
MADQKVVLPAVCTADDEQVVKDILSFFYPERTPTTGKGSMASLACRMFDELTECSKMMDHAPRPAGFKPGMAYPITWLLRSAWQKVKGNPNRYEICRTTIALKYKSEYLLAQHGIEI